MTIHINMARKLIIFISCMLVANCAGKTILEEIRDTETLSQAWEIIDRSEVVKAIISSDTATIFLPNNEAMEKYNGPKDADFLKYHLVNVPYLVQAMPDEMPTTLSGNPKIYVTRFPTGKPVISGGEDQDFYVNNAKIIGRNIVSDNGKQILHILDEAMEPIRKVDASVGYAYPKAYDLLRAARSYGFDNKNSLKTFQTRVGELNASDVFAMSGKNTFFIPVDQALIKIKPEIQDIIDKPVIHGHIVPDQAIFTRTFQKNEQYESHALTDNLRVYITMENVESPDDVDAYYVKSHVIAGDDSHQVGTVLSRILKANIPVANGVVHLIDRPLMVVASSIISYLQNKDGQLSKFHHLMKDRYPDLSNMLVSQTDLTLFAPSNHAFDMVNKERMDAIISNNQKLKDLLRMHIVRNRLTTDAIINRSKVDAETINNRRTLYFAVTNPEHTMPTVTLDGGGVNATITTPNIATKNGVIHIIDRILGIPSQTVYEKLASDPKLSLTFDFAKQNGWANKFNRRDDKFTIFAPNDAAWEFVERQWPSTYKKIKMGEFTAQVRAILERHTIAHQELKMNRLMVLTDNATQVDPQDKTLQNDLQMTRGKIYFQAKPKTFHGAFEQIDYEYYLEWNGISAKVIRYDVECVNGVVHVIDKVLMMKRDMTVNSAPTLITNVGLMISSLATFFIARIGALH